MNKGQFSFAIAGVLFGFLLGFVVAHQIYVGRGGPGFEHPPIPPGMTGSGPAGGTSPGGGRPSQAAMEAVTQEVAALREVLEGDAGNVPALTRLGNLFFDAAMYDAAVEHYTRALEVEPGNVTVRTDLGTSLRRSGRSEEALSQFERAVADDPAHWRGWFNVGVVALYDLGRYERAEEAFGKVEELNPGAIDMGALRAEIRRLRSEAAGGGPS